MIIKISSLLRDDSETKQAFKINQKPDFKDLGFEIKDNLKGEIELKKIGKDIYANINLNTKASFECQCCLKIFSKKLEITNKKYLFYFKKPHNLKKDEEYYLINMNNMTINLFQPIRQEIILATPYKPVCKENCKGFCPKCTKNLNKSECKCTIDDDNNKPLSCLKNLLNK